MVTVSFWVRLLGDEACNALTQGRVDKSRKLLEAIAQIEDTQTGLSLLRQCSSFGKMAYQIRATPVSGHVPSLPAFDDSVRSCFERLVGFQVSDDQWLQASLADT